MSRICMKKGQLTLLLLAAAILVMAVAFNYHLQGMQRADIEQPIELSLDNTPLKVWLEACIERASAKAAYPFGMQQGYFSHQEPFLKTENATISFYALNETNIMPSNDIFEEEFSKILDGILASECMDEPFFEQQGYVITAKTPKTKSILLENSVLLDITYPITIGTQSKNTIGRFSYTLPYRIGHVINVSRLLVQSVIENPYTLDATLIGQQDLAIMISRYDACNHIYLMIDNRSRIPSYESPYAHTFAVGYSDEYCDWSENK